MLLVQHTLERLNIHTSIVTHAVTDIAKLVNDSTDPLYTASKLFNDILSVPVRFTDNIHARIAAKHMIKDVLTYHCKIDNDDVQDIITEAISYADEYCANPDNSYLWSKPDLDNVTPILVQEVKGTDMKVVVNTSGKIKKGQKQVIAAELYAQYVLNAAVPMTNTEFKQVLIDKLDMTPLGASTYCYNLRKEHKSK